MKTAAEISKQKTPRMRITKRMRDMLGNLSDNAHWRIQLAGPPGAGKSSFSFSLADDFTRIGKKVLYVNTEEREKTGTITDKLQKMKVYSDDIYILLTENEEEIFKELKTGKYDIVILDSLSVLYDTERTIKQFLSHFNDEFPEIPLMYILHYTKRNTFRGSNILPHLADIVLKLENYKVETKKNRFLKKGQPLPEWKL